jgi:hypothetical protein
MAPLLMSGKPDGTKVGSHFVDSQVKHDAIVVPLDIRWHQVAHRCSDHAASMTWVANNGEGAVMDLYEKCLTAVRG